MVRAPAQVLDQLLALEAFGNVRILDPARFLLEMDSLEA